MKRFPVLLAFVLAVLAGCGLWYMLALRPVDSSDSVRQMVEIPQGASVTAIAGLLEEKNVIRSARAFRLHTRIRGVESQVKAGSFVLRRSQSAPEILGILTKGYGDEASLTIPEGFTVTDIDALLAEKDIIGAGEFTACARTCDFSAFEFLPATGGSDRGGRVEGYLFPDTYFVVKEELLPKTFAERLLSTFRRRVSEGLKDDLAASKRSLHEIVTMASLIEEEAITDEERPVISGILWKRFDAGMGLGVDAAVRYALKKPRGPLTKTDLEVDSPYNLRKVRGLPPGPIANPSLASIKAALSPKDTDYWYYLHDANRQIHYAVTNDEHNQNRARYLR